MAEIVRMPKMSDTMTEGVVSKWHKKVGDSVKPGEVLAEIETDKATMDFESFQEGALLYIGVEEGKGAPVNSILAILGQAGEDYKPLLAEEGKPLKVKNEKSETATVSKPNVPAAKPAEPQPDTTTVSPQSINQPVNPSTNSSKASPLARKLAQEKGIDLSRVMGTGDSGRIVKRDIDWYKPSPMAAYTPAGLTDKENFDEIPVSQMRKIIAKRLAESKFSAPHFYLTLEINMDNAVNARESINRVASSKISFNDIVIKAAASALRQHPKVNSSWQGDTIRVNHHIHIGVAVAVEEGLLVPVIRFADGKTLTQIGAEVKNLSDKAKNKKLQPADWEGNTFTISNLGMFGIDEFTAIINPPDACILAVGAIKQKPVVKEGEIKIGNRMNVTLSCDHRVVDGVTGSQFLQTLQFLLENPVVLFGQATI